MNTQDSVPRSAPDDADANGRDTGPMPIVGIGASAGGIVALKAFFEHMPANSGMGFVVILHLAPDRESTLDSILTQETDMPVQQAKDGMPVAANHVYVIPAGQRLTIEDVRLQLSEPPAQRQHSAIDEFFRSLAADQGANAVAMVLSGAGTDGTIGLREVHKQGGVALAQDPEEATHDGMPRSAIATGLVDLVLPAADLAKKLVEYRNHAGKLQISDSPDDLNTGDRDTLQKILRYLYEETGHDFSRYKRSMVLRRLQRRLQVNARSSLDEYLTFLREHDDEVERLRKDLLITVTSFFRDPEAFERLEKEVIPKLFEGKDRGDQVRVWVPGCASGEEAYALAMLLVEQAEQLDAPPAIQIFASDVDEQSLEVAREGRYPDPIKNDVSPARLRRFFDDMGTYYQVRPDLRKIVLFAEHNLLADPPFSNLDLVSCRNLLIYLDEEVQGDVLNVFHYALREHGYLFLGRAEAGSRTRPLFIPIDRLNNIYQARADRSQTLRQPAHFPTLQKSLDIGQHVPPQEVAEPRDDGETPENPEAFHQRAVMQDMASVLVNENLQVLHMSPGASRYLKLDGGTITDDLLTLVPDELRPELQSALFQAFENGKTTRRTSLRVTVWEEPQHLDLSVHPVLDNGSPTHARVEFEEAAETASDRTGGEAEDRSRVNELQEELNRTREQLQMTHEEYETATENMKAANEELQSMNEELQSKNEELETSQEELQSLNEELKTTNEELKHKIEEVGETNTVLENLMEATQIATLFLDPSLRIQRFTPETTELFNIQPADVGRLIADFTQRFEYEGLIDDAQAVLDSQEAIERELQTSEGKYFVARLQPYRTITNTIQGIVLTFMDVTERRKAELALRRSERFHRLAVEAGRIGTWQVNLETDKCYFSARMADMVGQPPEEDREATEQWEAVFPCEMFLDRVWPSDRPALAAALTAARDHKEPLEEEFRVKQADGSVRWLRATGDVGQDPDDETPTLHAASVDITGLKEGEQRARAERDFLDGVLRTVGTLVMVLDREGRILRVNEAFEDALGYNKEEITGRKAVDLLLAPDLQVEIRNLLDEIRAGKGPITNENDVLTKDGSQRRIRWTNAALRDEDGRVTHFITSGLDVTERRELEQDLTDAGEQIRRQIGRNLHDGLSSDLAGLTMIAESLKNRLDEKGLDEAERMDDIVRIAQESANKSRNLSHTLIPVGLQEETLATALEQLCIKQGERSDLRVRFEGDGEETLPADPEMAIQLYRIAQEGVSNAVQHSEGTEVAVSLQREGNRLVLTIRDDGRGLPDDVDEVQGIGLRSMSYRANLIGGRLAIESSDDGGTQIRLELPLSKAESS